MKLAFALSGTLAVGSILGAAAALSTPASPVYHPAYDFHLGNPSGIEDPEISRGNENGPDHYPLTTRAGTFAVEDLWKRRPQRMRPFDFAVGYSEEAFEPAAYTSELSSNNADASNGAPYEQLLNDGSPDAAGATRPEQTDSVGVKELAALPSGEEASLP